MAISISSYVSDKTLLSEGVFCEIEKFHENIMICKKHEQIERASSNYANFCYQLHTISINKLHVAMPIGNGYYKFSLGVFGEVDSLTIDVDGEKYILITKIVFNPPWDIFLDEKRARRYYASTPRIAVAPPDFVSKKDIGFGFEECQTPDGYFYINKKGRRKILTPVYKKLYSPFQERNGEWFAIIQHKNGRLEAFSQKGNLIKMTKDWQDVYSLRPNEFYGMFCESIRRITQSDICRIVELAVREYLNRQALNETYTSDAEYEIIDGDRIEMRHESLLQKGWFNDIRMYHSPNKTYCLLRRCDNGKYFYTLIVPAPELGKDETKFEIIPYKSVPFSIRQDSLSLLRKDGTQRNEIFAH